MVLAKCNIVQTFFDCFVFDTKSETLKEKLFRRKTHASLKALCKVRGRTLVEQEHWKILKQKQVLESTRF